MCAFGLSSVVQPVSDPGDEAGCDAARSLGVDAPLGAAIPLPRLLVGRMLAAVPAEFPVLHPPRLLLLVLRGGIVPPLAIAAFQRDDISHGVALQFCETIVHSCRACDRD